MRPTPSSFVYPATSQCISTATPQPTLYFLIDDALLFLSSATFAFSSLTRLCNRSAYSDCAGSVSHEHARAVTRDETYGGLLLVLRAATLEGLEVALVLETLWGDEALDAGSLGVGLGTLLLGLDFAADDELADLWWEIESQSAICFDTCRGILSRRGKS